MLSFSVNTTADSGRQSVFSFSVESSLLAFAGSRSMIVDPLTCKDLVSMFGSLGFSFITGCADGVDSSFRSAISDSDYLAMSIVACAFKSRYNSLKGVYPLYVVPDNIPPRAALARRTLWITSRFSMLILFPSDPISRGSALAFKSAIMNSKPVFVVTDKRPKDSSLYLVFRSNLFGIVNGFWCIPPVYSKTGLCYEVT